MNSRKTNKEHTQDIRDSILLSEDKEAEYARLWNTSQESWTLDDLESLANYLRRIVPRQPEPLASALGALLDAMANNVAEFKPHGLAMLAKLQESAPEALAGQTDRLYRAFGALIGGLGSNVAGFKRQDRSNIKWALARLGRSIDLRFLRFILDNGGRSWLEMVPSLLAGMQGNKLAGLLLDSQAASRRHSSLMPRFREVRAVLGGYRFGRKVDLGEAEITQLLYHDYEALVDEMEQEALERTESVTVANFQTSLGANEATLLLAEAPPRNEGGGGDHLLVFLIEKRAVRCLELPGLLRLQDALAGYERVLERTRGKRAWREGPRRSAVHAEGPAPAEMHKEAVTALMKEVLWTPLTDICPRIARMQELRIVTQGALHAFPYDWAFPGEETRLRHFPGLLLYCRHYRLGGSAPLPAVPAAWEVGYAGYDAIGHPRGEDPVCPIPMVAAELALAQRLWPEGRALAPECLTDVGLPLRLACLAGHGVTDPELQALYDLAEGQAEPDRPSAMLLGHETLSATDRLLGFNDALGWEPVPSVVLLSACVVGRVSEDPDGDPLGVVTGFLLQGARYVVGSLQPVDDYYMPLFVCLFQQGLKLELEPTEALSQAKRRLCSGDWYEDTYEHVRAIYAETIDAYRRRPEVDWGTLLGWSDTFSEIGVTELKAGTDTDWGAWIDHAVTDLIERRAQLPVSDLAASIRGFGSGKMH